MTSWCTGEASWSATHWFICYCWVPFPTTITSWPICQCYVDICLWLRSILCAILDDGQPRGCYQTLRQPGKSGTWAHHTSWFNHERVTCLGELIKHEAHESYQKEVGIKRLRCLHVLRWRQGWYEVSWRKLWFICRLQLHLVFLWPYSTHNILTHLPVVPHICVSE